MWWAIAAALIPVVVKGIGTLVASGDRQKAEQERQAAMQEYNIELPPIDQLETEMQGNTELAKVIADPNYTIAQNDALAGIKQMATSDKLAPEDIAMLEQSKMQAAGVERGILGRNEQEMRARGISGSGLDYANQMNAGQQAINRSYMGGIQAAGDASQRRQNALYKYGDFAARLRESDLGQKNRQATAQDEINRFNTADRRDVRDVNAGADDRRFGQAVQLGDRKAQTRWKLAGASDQAADRTEDAFAEAGEGISDATSSYAEYDMNKKKKQ